MRKITNTEDEMKNTDKALGFLGMGLIVGGSNAIEMQEGEGQRELVKSAQLPTRGLNDPALSMITVVGPTEGDPLFSDVVLPAGWRKQATSHAMWSDLLDEKGWKRAAIFYKAAFYDRSAHIMACQRYGWGKDYDYTAASRFRVKDNATGEVLFVTAETPDPFPQNGTISREESFKRSDAEKPLEDEARTWIDTHFPQWRDAAAYWSD
jgi:hypothetical protein